jgi:hypothetical protein
LRVDPKKFPPIDVYDPSSQFLIQKRFAMEVATPLLSAPLAGRSKQTCALAFVATAIVNEIAIQMAAVFLFLSLLDTREILGKILDIFAS